MRQAAIGSVIDALEIQPEQVFFECMRQTISTGRFSICFSVLYRSKAGEIGERQKNTVAGTHHPWFKNMSHPGHTSMGAFHNSDNMGG